MVKVVVIVAGLTGCGVINGVTGDPGADRLSVEDCVEPIRQWTQLTTLGTPPTARMGHVAIYDSTRQRLIVHGGTDANNYLLSDTWALSLSPGTESPTWYQLSSATLPRYGHSLAFDADHERAIAFGGSSTSFPEDSDVWALSLSGTPNWSKLGTTGTPALARMFGGVEVDRAGQRLVVVAGLHEWAPANILNDTWALELGESAGWAQPTSGPGLDARYGFASVVDEASRRIIVFGGAGPSGMLNDVWTLALDGTPTWTKIQIDANVPMPMARFRPAGVFDPIAGGLVVFGGYSSTHRILDDVWLLRISDGVGTWQALAVEGSAPARHAHTAVHDAAHRRLLVFGGMDQPIMGMPPYSAQNDVWALPLAHCPASDQTAP